jgi:hypothetical protein
MKWVSSDVQKNEKKRRICNLMASKHALLMKVMMAIETHATQFPRASHQVGGLRWQAMYSVCESRNTYLPPSFETGSRSLKCLASCGRKQVSTQSTCKHRLATGVFDCACLGTCTCVVEKFAFGDRTIPIHARTLGPHLESPNVMGVYYGTVQSAVVHTN